MVSRTISDKFDSWQLKELNFPRQRTRKIMRPFAKFIVNCIQNHAITRTNELWKECKLLGRLLDTDKGSSRRKSLAKASMKNLKYIFCNPKLSIAIKTRVFNC